MQSVLVASTALMGLSVVFVAQLRLAPIDDVKARLGKFDYDRVKIALFCSLTFGFLTIILSLTYFLAGHIINIALAATVSSGIQLASFYFVIILMFFPKHWPKKD